MKVAILSPEEHNRIMAEWRSAQAATESAAKASDRYIAEHGRTSDELIEELVEAMNQQFQIMSQLQAKANGNG